MLFLFPSRRFWLSFFFIFSLLLSFVYLRVYFQARTEFHRAEALLAQRKLRRAIRHYSYVIKWYTPGNKYVVVAISRIKKLSQHAYEQGNWSLATFGFQKLRNALRSIRSFYQPHADILHFTHKKLAALLTLLPGKDPSNSAHNDLISKKLIPILSKAPELNPFAALAASLFFFLYLWQALRFLTSEEEQREDASFQRFCMSLFVSFLLWLFFLSLA